MAENFFHREKSGIDIILMEKIIHNMVSELKFFLCEETEQKKKKERNSTINKPKNAWKSKQ